MISFLHEEIGDNEVFTACDKETVLAKCTYSAKTAEIFDVEIFDCPDVLVDGLIKSVLSRLDYMGKVDVFSENKALYPLLERLKFEEKDGVMKVNTVGYFKKSCEEFNKNEK